MQKIQKNIRSLNISIIDEDSERRAIFSAKLSRNIHRNNSISRIFLCHIKNRDFITLEQIEDHNVIWYTGGSPEIEEKLLEVYHTKSPLVIQQSLSQESLREISNDDLKELVEYMDIEISNRKYIQMPKLLCNNLELTIALYILCQGYLAIYFKKLSFEKILLDDPILKEAGYYAKFSQSFIDDINLSKDDCLEKFKFINQPSWWLTTLIKKEDEITSKINQEWREYTKESSYVHNLISMIFSSEDTLDSAKISNLNSLQDMSRDVDSLSITPAIIIAKAYLNIYDFFISKRT
jgi:hypothetical protein